MRQQRSGALVWLSRTRVGEVGLYAFEACVVSRFVLVVQALFALTMKAPFVLFTRP